MTEKPSREFFIAGGTLRPDAPSYIERQADQELYDATLRGEFCYVLTSRQMGKSSLMARTAQRLNRGVNTAIIDLTQIGGEQGTIILDQWYYGIIHQILRALGIKVDLQGWWNDRQQVSPVQRLTECFNDLILQQTQKALVIFIDEIDSTINLPFTDDFFAAIRACHNARATNDAYERLTFVLLGVATPSQLIKDQTRTPFNVGHRIDLTDFSWEEAKPLAQGLGPDALQSEALLQRVLEWTGGHPYLTQKLCHLLTQHNGQTLNPEDVDRLVEKHFLAPESSKDEYNLKFVRDRLTSEPEETRELLQLYRNILKGQAITDDTLSRVHNNLKLSGLVVPQSEGALTIRNKIYQQVFDVEWVETTLPRDRVKWAVVTTAAACLLAFIVWYLLFLPKPYIQQLQLAKEDVPTEAYESLKNIPGFSGKADELLAQYWDRRAVRAASSGDRDRQILLVLRALTLKNSEKRLQYFQDLVGNDYQRLVGTLRHGGAVFHAEFSSNGDWVVSASDDGTAGIWEVKEAKGRVSLMKHNNQVSKASFSPNDRFILTSSDFGTFSSPHLWKWDGTGQLAKLDSSFDLEGNALFSPDGQSILSNSRAYTSLILQRLDGTGEPIRLDTSLAFSVQSVFSHDGQFILTFSKGYGNDFGVLWMWRTDGKSKPVLLRNENEAVKVATFSLAEKKLITGSVEGAVWLWNIDKGKNFRLVRHWPENDSIFSYHKRGREALDSWKLASDYRQSDWKVFPIGLKVMAKRKPRVKKNVKFSPNGTYILVEGGNDPSLFFRADGTGESVKLGSSYETAGFTIFSPDSQYILTVTKKFGNEFGVLRIWPTDAMSKPIKLGASGDNIENAVFSPDGKLILTTSERIGLVKVWRADGSRKPIFLDGHNQRVNHIAFAPKGNLTVTVSNDGTGRIWRFDDIDNSEDVVTNIKKVNPNDLLENWARRLGLKFQSGNIVSRWPTKYVYRPR